MSELHAAVGESQLRRLEEFLDVRRRAGRRYDAGLAGIAGVTPVPIDPRCEPNFYKYVALLEPGVDRAEFKRRMRDEHGVGMSGEVYASPLHQQPIFEAVAHGPLPVSEDVCARQVCFPVHSDITDEEVDVVVRAAREVLA
jgi:dTDP-4-amino-4,6-dideoxygalactose transaminase